MTKQEEAKLIEARKKNPRAGRMTLVAMTGLGEKKVREWLKRQGCVVHFKVSEGASNTAKRGKTLADFRNSYDKSTIVPAKVKAALNELGASGWDYESAFHKLAGVSLQDLAMFRELFADHIVNLRDNKRAWAGSVKTANIMREMI